MQPSQAESGSALAAAASSSAAVGGYTVPSVARSTTSWGEPRLVNEDTSGDTNVLLPAGCSLTSTKAAEPQPSVPAPGRMCGPSEQGMVHGHRARQPPHALVLQAGCVAVRPQCPVSPPAQDHHTNSHASRTIPKHVDTLAVGKQ